VEVTLDSLGNASYIIKEDVAWDNIPFSPDMELLAKRADAVCFGSLVQRMASRDTIFRFLNAMRPDALKVFDINLRQHYYSVEILEESLHMADILKINEQEMGIVASLLSLPGFDIAAGRALISRYGLRLVILTKGEKGSEVITAEEVIPQAASEVEVADTVGAGDSFTAAFIVALLHGASLQEAQRLASDTAAFVCSRKGAMPV
jgi:fructokinase